MVTVEDVQKRIGVAKAELRQVHSDLMTDGISGNDSGIGAKIAILSKVTALRSKTEMLLSKIELLELMKEIVEVKEEAVQAIQDAKRQLEL